MQLCYNVIQHVESHCNSIVKTKTKILFSFSLSVSLLSHSLNCLPRLSLSDFSLSFCSPSSHRWPPSPSNSKPRSQLDVLLRCGCGLLRSVYHGSSSGVGLDPLWPVGLDHGDRWVWIGGDWWVSGFGLVLCVWIGATCGFGSVLLWLCLVIVVVGGGFWQFFVFLFLFVGFSCGCCWWRVWLLWCLLADGMVVARWPFSCGCSCYG